VNIALSSLGRMRPCYAFGRLGYTGEGDVADVQIGGVGISWKFALFSNIGESLPVAGGTLFT